MCPSETFVADQAQDAQAAVTVVVAFEAVAEEVEPRAGLIQIDDPSLGRMQRQAGVCRPLLHLGQGVVRFFCRVAEDHEIICVAHHRSTALGHLVVQVVEVNA